MSNSTFSVVSDQGHAMIGELPFCAFSANLLTEIRSARLLKGYKPGEVTCVVCIRRAEEVLWLQKNPVAVEA